ncbi:hypothetical protein BDW68DRAFT_157612 [Aspergillus falconensis]
MLQIALSGASVSFISCYTALCHSLLLRLLRSISASLVSRPIGRSVCPGCMHTPQYGQASYQALS